jgi:hypothetical protein
LGRSNSRYATAKTKRDASMTEKCVAKKALQSLTRLRQGVNPFDTEKLGRFFEDQKIYAECTKKLNVPEDYSNYALHSLQLISRGTI